MHSYVFKFQTLNVCTYSYMLAPKYLYIYNEYTINENKLFIYFKFYFMYFSYYFGDLRWDHTIVVMHQSYTIFIVLNMSPIKKLSQSNSLQSDDCPIVHKVAFRKFVAAFQSNDCSSIWQL